MAAKPRKLAHAELDRLGQRLADAREAEREAEAALVAAEAAVESARDRVREAHDLNANPASATEALEQAKQDAEQAVLRLEGVGQRVRRAGAARESYLELRYRAETSPGSARLTSGGGYWLHETEAAGDDAPGLLIFYKVERTRVIPDWIELPP